MTRIEVPPGEKEKPRSRDTVVFHYDRRRRLNARGAPPERERGLGILKRNPSLKILLLDLLVILLLGLGMRFWLTYEKDTGKFAGYWVKLEALPVKDKLFVSLELEKTRAADPFSEPVQIIFRLPAAKTEVIREITAFSDPELPLEVSLTLPLAAKDKKLEVKLNGQGQHATYSKRFIRQ